MPLVATAYVGLRTLADNHRCLQGRQRQFLPDEQYRTTPLSPKDVSAERLAKQAGDS